MIATAFPPNPVMGQLYNKNGSTFVFTGTSWKTAFNSDPNDEVAYEDDGADESTLKQTIEILRELNNSYKDEIHKLKETVRAQESDLYVFKAVGNDPKEVKKYIIELQKEIRALESRSTLVAPPTVNEYSSTGPLNVITVPLRVTDTLAIGSFRDPMTFSTNIHLVFKSGDSIRRHSTMPLEDMARNNFPAQAVSDTFDAMAAAIKKEFMDEVYKNLGN